ncbi:MAG: HDOD domain-containing protein [Pseudomonadota bacterium]
MEKEKAQDLLARLESGYSLPALSPVALKLVELATEETCSAKDLANLVEKDPSLGVRLLKLANSAFFRTTSPITTISQAIVKVGFQRLRVMALSISLRDTFPMGKVGPLDYEEFWRISLYRALIAKSLAERLKTYNPDEAFVTGLIMEIGLLIFFDFFIKGMHENISLELDSLENLISWEREHFGVDHRQVGEAALRYWKFPDHIVLCQQAYRNEDSSQEQHPLVRLCELARVLSQIVSKTSDTFYVPYAKAKTLLGLDQNIISDILVTTFDQVQEIADNLSVEMNKEKDLIEIVEKANRALSRISEKIFSSERSADSDSLPTFDSIDKEGDSTARTLQAVAHELRNPLLVVGGFARKLASSVDPDSEGGRYVQIILQEASRLEKALSEMTRKKG